MAFISKKKGKYVVRYDNPKPDFVRDAVTQKLTKRRSQLSRSFGTETEAKLFLLEIEMKTAKGSTIIVPSKMTFEAYSETWLKKYAKKHWGHSMYDTSVSALQSHIMPELGHLPLQDITPYVMEEYFDNLAEKRQVSVRYKYTPEDEIPFLSSTSRRRIFDLLKVIFDEAVKWELLERSPLQCDRPPNAKSTRQGWSSEQMAVAIKGMQSEPLLQLLVGVTFTCALRSGETGGLTWDCVDLEEGSITVNKTMKRLSDTSLKELPTDEIQYIFPKKVPTSKTSLVLKDTKTEGSNRKVFLPEYLKQQLFYRKQKVQIQKGLQGELYSNHNLVFCLDDGTPIEPNLNQKWFKKWQDNSDLGLPPIVFHELRHTGASHIFRMTRNFDDVKGSTGQMNDQTVRGYVHESDQDKIALAEKQNRFYDSVTGGTAKKNKIEQDNNFEAILLEIMTTRQTGGMHKGYKPMLPASA